MDSAPNRLEPHGRKAPDSQGCWELMRPGGWFFCLFVCFQVLPHGSTVLKSLVSCWSVHWGPEHSSGSLALSCALSSPLHTHTDTHTHSQFYHCSTQGLLWRFHKVRISICLSFFLIHSPALYSSQSKSDFETGHQLVLLKSAPLSAWPIAVLGGTEYSDEPRVCPSLWELEHSLMDSPTNYVCDWSEERGLQK